MIPQFDSSTALLLIDTQQGVNVPDGTGAVRRVDETIAAEDNLRSLLGEWRARGLPVAFTRHDSREAASPLKLSLADRRPDRRAGTVAR